MFEKFRVGIMGTGKIATIMFETIKQMRGVTVYAVGSRSEESAMRFAKTYGVKKYYGSYEELVNDPKVNLIYVATPHSEHFANVKLALSAGKNVICEKAFMLNEAEAKEAFALAEEKKLLLTEAMWTRYMPMVGKLKEVLASNVIGEPTMLTANLGYNIAYKDRINDPALGGGALLDLGVYVLNFASMVFGDDVADIASICSYNDRGMDMQDSITLRYPDGRMAVLNATAISNSDRSGVIYGSKGYIVVENINNPEAIAVYDSEYKKVAHYKRPNQISGYEYEIEACMKAISENWLECPQMPHAVSLKMLSMMDFIRKNNNIYFPGEERTSSDLIPLPEQAEHVGSLEAPGNVAALEVPDAGQIETTPSAEYEATEAAADVCLESVETDGALVSNSENNG